MTPCLFVGVATLLPYLPIFLDQLGLTSTELSLIYGLIFFLTFAKNILVGLVADRYRLHKVLLVTSCVLTGPLYCILIGVPSNTNITTELVPCVTNRSNVTSYDVNVPDNSTVAVPPCRLPDTLSLPSPCERNRSECIVRCDRDGNPTLFSTSCLMKVRTTTTDRSYVSLTFWLCLTIVLLASLCGSNQLILNDAIAFTLLGE